MHSSSRCVLLTLLATASFACTGCTRTSSPDAQGADASDRYWRVEIVVIGKGAVVSGGPTVECISGAAGASTKCDTVMVGFPKSAPPTVEAIPAPGWRFDRWSSVIHGPQGAAWNRHGRIPPGTHYSPGAFYTDMRYVETLTAVFVEDTDE